MCILSESRYSFGKGWKELSVDELSDVMLRLQDNKADNINLVTPTHFTIPIIKAIEKARNKRT